MNHAGSPTVSVVIPSYNRAGMVSEAIGSVLQQTYRDVEIIVVDDGSTDNTTEVLRTFGDSVRRLHQPNAGPSAARNLGIRQARGRFIALLDADDRWLPHKLQTQMDYLAQHPHTGLVCSDFEIHEGTRVVVPSYLAGCKRVRDGHIFDECIEEYLILTSSVIVKRECLDKVGLFDEELRYAEDRDLWLRISFEYDIGIVREVLVIKRNPPDNLTAEALQESRAIPHRIRVFEKALDMPGLEPRSVALLRRELSAQYFDLGYGCFMRGKSTEARRAFGKSLSQNWRNRKAAACWIASWLPSAVVRGVRRWKGERTAPAGLEAGNG